MRRDNWTIKRWQKELWIVVSRYIKMRDKNKCQWCDNKEVIKGSNCHVSHVIPKSQGNMLRFDEMNLKVLCYHHHLNVWHKDPIKANAWFTEKFPERWEYLEKNRHRIVKFKIWDYQEMFKVYKEKIKIMEGNYGKI